MAWRRTILTGVLATAGGIGYGVGKFETDRLVLSAGEAAYGKGKAETEATLSAQYSMEKEDVRREADFTGYARGQSELALSRKDDKALVELIVKAFAILQDPKVLTLLSAETAKSIGDSREAFNRDDFEGASQSLPQLVELLPDRNCVESMQTFEARQNDAFDLCESGSEIVVTRIQLSSKIQGAEVSIDGEEQWQLLGARYTLKNNCYLTLQRVIEAEGPPAIQMRAGCE